MFLLILMTSDMCTVTLGPPETTTRNQACRSMKSSSLVQDATEVSQASIVLSC